ncbi:hypothetical protein RKE29_11310 [Streptomyces sp. B1866]|uniref:hypothetical protein n=1 Tax=Streptomyces sp. B1866 TaxID=3075431 RepID=UPI002891FEAC|nr:hypothetical protein [Streptomyces sp. B1866]MDT3397226.1 hypothetical protein [Streptomyces sp. B1866]
MSDVVPITTAIRAWRTVKPADVPARDPRPDVAPPQWHRGMTLIGAVSLFIGTRSVWASAMSNRPSLAAVVSLCYAGILVTGVLALAARTSRALIRVDLAVLLIAVALTCCRLILSHNGSDEGVLTSYAARELLHGRPVYDQPWPWLFDRGVAITPTMDGGADYTYGYPPLAVLLTAPVYAVVHGAGAATVVATGSLIAGTVALWILLPAPWRSAATAVCLGFGMLPTYARLGYPAVTALALLIPVVVRWPRTGAGGRLGRGGVLRAGCLGAACAAQQLPWFLIPFLLVGLYAVRRGELGNRRALAVLARYTGLAASTWLAINAYFAIQDFRGWVAGVTLLLRQGAIPHGQGVVDISYYFTDGTGRLSFYTYGSVLLAAGLLTALALFVGRLGPALTVLPWCVFFFATRSQDGYFLLMTPLWLAAAATVSAADFRTAWRPRLPARLRGPGRRARAGRAAVLAGCLLPAVACTCVAAASPPPLTFGIAPVHTDHGMLRRVVFEATNTTGKPLEPHFAIGVGQSTSRIWDVVSGPETLAPHQTARYVIAGPDGGGRHVPDSHRVRVRLRAFSAHPQTVSSADIHVPDSERG